MAKFKICSDPYNNNITYQKWNPYGDAWEDYSYLEDPNSKLFNKKLEGVYFSFKAKEILDIFLEDYCDGIDGETIEIVFEGSEDEYIDLEELCRDEEYNSRVKLTRSRKKLSNARDILPKIVEMFDEMKPLLVGNSKDENTSYYVDKFLEASGRTIPICVIGNYSSGKSTFINALIGDDILPSDSEPVTTRIYKIYRSLDPRMAKISFKIGESLCCINISKENIEINAVECSLIEQINASLNQNTSAEINEMTRKVIDIINNYDGDELDKSSSLIEVEVPFGSGIIAESQYSFVIFDTPGSGSASHEEHTNCLKQALIGLTNGIPVYISDFEDLDKTDNEKLCDEILQMKEFDSRFTIIVVNKADAVQLPINENEIEEKVLSEVVPKKLYSEGVFFTSSIMGLGAKTEGLFDNPYYSEVYDEKLNKFSNPDSTSYRCLYKYNIMPKHLKKRAQIASEACDNLIYANSGLYWVEKEIETFAEKYSPYNKCKQSKNFLNNVIVSTGIDLSLIKKAKENKKEKLYKEYAAKKNSLKTDIINESSKFDKELYINCMIEESRRLSKVCSISDLNGKESCIRIANDKKYEIQKLARNVEKARKNIATNPQKLLISIKTFNECSGEYNNAKKHSDEQTRKELLLAVKDSFSENKVNAARSLEEKSRKRLLDAANELREGVINIVTESTALEEEQREELRRKIINFKEFIIDDSCEKIFEREEFFKDAVYFLNFKIKELDTLNLETIKKVYDERMQSLITDCSKTICKMHLKSFTSWNNSLQELVNSNLESYNPSLANQRAAISNEEKAIAELTEKMGKLNAYAKRIEQLMEPKAI